MTGVLLARSRRRLGVVDCLRVNTIARRFLIDGRWRRTATVLAIALATVIGYEKVAVEFMHDRRQDRLVSQFTNSPRSSELRFGDALAVLQIPKLSLNAVVSEGESHATMRAGPAHLASSVMPGARGNAVIAGKAFRYGAPFARLKQLEPGSEIYVKLRASDPVKYVVDSVEVMARGDTTTFESTDNATLTLVTSTSRLGGDSLVVRATAIEGTTIVDPPAGSVAPASEDGVSFTDFAVLATWFAVCVALLSVLSRSPTRLSRVVRVAIFAPTILLGGLQFALAFERLFPATV